MKFKEIKIVHVFSRTTMAGPRESYNVEQLIKLNPDSPYQILDLTPEVFIKPRSKTNMEHRVVAEMDKAGLKAFIIRDLENLPFTDQCPIMQSQFMLIKSAYPNLNEIVMLHTVDKGQSLGTFEGMPAQSKIVLRIENYLSILMFIKKYYRRFSAEQAINQETVNTHPTTTGRVVLYGNVDQDLQAVVEENNLYSLTMTLKFDSYNTVRKAYFTYYHFAQKVSVTSRLLADPLNRASFDLQEVYDIASHNKKDQRKKRTLQS